VAGARGAPTGPLTGWVTPAAVLDLIEDDLRATVPDLTEEDLMAADEGKATLRGCTLQASPL
jgi:hypothetical protein